MQKLNFPTYSFRIQHGTVGEEIFDPVRKKFVKLTPEEWVRQHLISYLMIEKKVPSALLGIEKALKVNKLVRRFDVVVFNRNAEAILLAECKAPCIDISEKVFDQAARYNLTLKAQYFLITNGLEHYTCRLDYESKQYFFIPEIPDLI